jgi:hypothetical protein
VGSPTEPPMPVTLYKSWQAVSYPMHQFDGKYVRVMIRTDDYELLQARRARELVDRADHLYSAMKDTLGWEPAGSGLLTIALAVDTCGSGCGIVSGKGIEVEVDFHAYGPTGIDAAFEAVWAIVIHEMAHNFDPIGGQIFYCPDTGHAWTSFFNFYAMVAAGINSRDHNPARQKPEEVLNRMVDFFISGYTRSTNSNWEGCIVGGECTFPSGTLTPEERQRGAQGGFLLQYAREVGAISTRRMLKHLIDRGLARPEVAQAPPIAKADLLAEAFSVGVDANVSLAFDLWKWGLSKSKREAIGSTFPHLWTAGLDLDGDGIPRILGDCDDFDTSVPGLPPSMPSEVASCETLSVSETVVEDTDFPGWESEPHVISQSVVVHGRIDSGDDTDRFRVAVDRPTVFQIRLVCPDSLGAWAFLAHTREYGVFSPAGGSAELWVTLKPGQNDLYIAPLENQRYGSYSLFVRQVTEMPDGGWTDPAACSQPQMARLVEGADFPGPAATIAEAKAIRFPSVVDGIYCKDDAGDSFKLTLTNRTSVRFVLESVENFSGWVFISPGGDYVYTESGWVGGGTFSLGPGDFLVRVQARPGFEGRYRLRVEEHPTAMTAMPPEPIALGGGRWGLRAEGIPVPGPVGGVKARFWVAGAGWVGEVPYAGGQATHTIGPASVPDSRGLTYRVQLFRDGFPITEPTESRAFPHLTNTLPVGIKGLGVDRESGDELHYHARFSYSRELLPSVLAVRVFVDGKLDQELTEAPGMIDVGGLNPGLHTIELGFKDQENTWIASERMTFVLFRNDALNQAAIVPGGKAPWDMRDVHLVQEYSAAALPEPDEVVWFESLSRVRTEHGKLESVDAILRLPLVRSFTIKGVAQRLAVRSLEGGLELRAAALGSKGRLMVSDDLVNWSPVPFFYSDAPDEVVRREVRVHDGARFYRWVED